MNSHDFFRRVTSNWPVKILSLVAAIILYLSYRIGTLEERFFSVPLNIVTNEGFVAVGEYPNSVRVSLKGQSDEIFLILDEDIEAYVDLTDHTREGQYRTPVLVNKSGTAEGSELELRVDPLDVTITQEEQVSELIDIHPSIRGFPAEGFELSEYSVEPSSVEIVGPRSVIALLPGAKTEDIDLTGRADSFTVRTKVVIGELRAEITGSDIVEFSGTVRPVVVAKYIGDIEIRPIGLAEGLSVSFEPGRGELRARGSVFIVDTLSAVSAGIEVDCSTIREAGEYELAVTARLPEGIEGLSIQPKTVIARVSNESDGSEDKPAGEGE